ncbi:MAG: DUF2171 domain-containing protein [Actinobacteria bacterium]|nr:MAG: DUF2171 domain-containing protein [Actinomycetota bacterium]
MGDPVSWLMIRVGWKVLAADGSEVGEVDEIAGDDTEDIFDGLAIATSSFGRPRYVPSEQVAGISDGAVRLSLTRERSRSWASISSRRRARRSSRRARAVSVRRWLPTSASSKGRCLRQFSVMSTRCVTHAFCG